MKFLYILLIFLWILPVSIFAGRQISIVSDKTLLQDSEILNITASYSGFTPGEEIIVKGAFFQPGSTNYFGLTHNGDNWIKTGSNTDDQKHIHINSTNEILEIKNDAADSGFKGSGTYSFKVGYYYNTSGGNRSSVHWSDNEITLSLVVPTPTITPVPATITPKPTTSPYPTATSIPTVSLEPTTIIIKKDNIQQKNTAEIADADDLLGVATESSLETSPFASDTGKQRVDLSIPPITNQNTYWLPLMTVTISLVCCLTACIWGILIWKQKKVSKHESL